MQSILSELDRRLANIVRVGTVTAFQAGAVDGSAVPMVQVDLGDLTTDWLPVAMSRAGGNASYDTPEVGEQVLLFAPSGELANAKVMGSIPQTSAPAKFTDQNNTGYAWSDGAKQTYDRAGHHYVLQIPDAGDLTLHVGASTLVLNNGAITATIGSTTLTLADGKATLATTEFDVNATLSKFSGAVTVVGLLTFEGGMSGSGTAPSGHTTDISGPVNISGATTLAGVTSNGKNISSTHSHSGVQPGSGNSGAVT